MLTNKQYVVIAYIFIVIKLILVFKIFPLKIIMSNIGFLRLWGKWKYVANILHFTFHVFDLIQNIHHVLIN